MPLRLLRAVSKSLLLPAMAALTALGVPATAHAQTAPSVLVTIANADSLGRTDVNGASVTKRQLLSPEGINLQDCRDSQNILFPVTVTGFATSDTFEIWASDQSGADCTDAKARTAAGSITCYKVEATFSRAPVQTISLPVKQFIKGLTGTVDSQGCRRVNAYTITVFFLVLRGTDVAGSQKKALLVDTEGPTALSNVRVLPGDGAVTISWDTVGEGGADDVIGAQAFCDPSPTPSGPTDGGATTTCTLADGAAFSVDASDDAAVEDAGATCTTVANPAGASGAAIPSAAGIPSDGKSCTTASFTPASGKLVPDAALKAKYGCGSIDGPTGNSIRIDSIGGAPPVNGQVYAVAVAATDSFGNLGEVSSPICQFPETTSDFWRDYRNAGGKSGGGCAVVEGPGAPVGSLSLLLVGGVVALSTMHRARRARSKGARRNDR